MEMLRAEQTLPAPDARPDPHHSTASPSASPFAGPHLHPHLHPHSPPSLTSLTSLITHPPQHLSPSTLITLTFVDLTRYAEGNKGNGAGEGGR